MADMMTAVSAVGLGLKAVGTGVSASGTLASGEASYTAGQMAATAARNSSTITATAQEQGGELAQTASEYTAEQLDQNAGATRAQGQRQAFDINQQTRLALSTLKARAAGSGLAGSGESTTALAGSIGGRGAYLSLTAMANGENSARGLEDQAYATRLSGAIAKYGGDLAATGTRYAGEAEAEADEFKGQSALTASQYGASGTIASGIGSALSDFGKLSFPTPTGRAGV